MCIRDRGRVQQLKREGKALPPDAAVDADGNMTTDADKVNALTTFGRHKGYGLSLINELMAAYIGGSLPTLRSRWADDSKEKHTCAFYFQVIHPDAVSSGDFALGRNQAANVKAVLDDVSGHGNDKVIFPGQIEAGAAARSVEHGGLLFSKAEVDEFNELAVECGRDAWAMDKLMTVEI